jgi:hypothetical protein
MVFLNWVQNNWFILLQSLGIITSICFAGISFRIDTKVRRVANLLEITKQHRDIWSEFYARPELKRVLKPSVNLTAHPITAEEELFVKLLILHLASAYRTSTFGMVTTPEELRDDISSFFGLPIPRAVWERMQHLQDHDFVRFVEQYRSQ